MTEYVRLGELLVGAGLISPDQLAQTLLVQEQDPSHQRLGALLVSLGLITDDHLCRALAVQLGLDLIDLGLEKIDLEAVATVPEQWAVRHQVVPIRIEGDTLYLATSDPTNRWIVEDIGQVTPLKVKLMVAPEGDIRVQLRRQYEALRNKQASEPHSAGGPDSRGQNRKKSLHMGKLGGGEQGAVQVVDRIIMGAMERKTSDVNLLAQPSGLIIRYRIDGVFQEVATVPTSLQASVISRLKILCSMDVTEHRRPMDGRSKFKVGDHEVDLRVAAFPTMHGESIVIRLLDRLEGLPQLDALGLRPSQLEAVLEHSRRPQGLVLLTGPTGSGKTTTIYALLNEIFTPELNVLTLEDPIEYEMAGIGQVQIDEKAGLTFAKGLRSFLRASPNIILVGEIRDLETAQLGFQAGLTGHLVLSTLHTNDAISTIMRLVSMGVEPYLISSTLSLVVAQRLIRRVCPNCRRSLRPSPAILRLLRITEEQAEQHEFFGGMGCEKCEGSGYKGRIGIYEVLTLTDQMRELILQDGREQDLRRLAREGGLRSLRQEALARAFQGATTLEEVVRVTDVRESLEDRCPRCGLPLPAPGQPCAKCAVMAKVSTETKTSTETPDAPSP